MNSFQALREEIAAALTEALPDTVTVTTDPRGQPPMVLVDAPSLVAAGNAGATWDVTVPVRIIHPPPGDASALAWLLDQLEPALFALQGTQARSTTYALNDKEHPAYSFDVVRTQATPC